MSQDEIVQATAASPGQTPAAQPTAEIPSRFRTHAVMSWLLAIVSLFCSLLLLFTAWDLPRFWFMWTALGIVLLLGFLFGILPLTEKTKQGSSGTKIHAIVGLVFNGVALCVAVLCILIAADYRHFVKFTYPAKLRAQQEKEAEAYRQANEERRAARIQQRQESIEQAEREKELAIQERRDFAHQFAEAIPTWDAVITQRFHEGPESAPVPTLPAGYEFPADYVPPVRNQPLQFIEHEVTVDVVEEDLHKGEPITVDDLTVQKVNLLEQSKYTRMNLTAGLWLNMVWGTAENSQLLYVLEGDTLREIDTADWHLKRVVHLGGTAVSVACCRSGIVVAVKDPDRILVLDPYTLQVHSAIPVAGLEQAAACPANDRLFVRSSVGEPFYELASLNLETGKIEYLLSLEEATRLGDGEQTASGMRGTRYVNVTADGGYLFVHAKDNYRWSIAEDGTLSCLESDSFTGSPHRQPFSPDGRLFAQGEAVHDITQSLDAPLGSYRDRIQLNQAAVANDGRSFSFEWNETNLIILDAEGNKIAEYVWLEKAPRSRSWQTMGVYNLPDPEQILVDTRGGWYVVQLP